MLIPDVMTVRTLADIRVLIELAEGLSRARTGAVARYLKAVAAGADPENVGTELMVAFAVDGIACRPATTPSQAR